MKNTSGLEGKEGSETYSEPCQTTKMECFVKIVNGQKLHIRCFKGFCIRLRLQNYDWLRLQKRIDFRDLWSVTRKFELSPFSLQVHFLKKFRLRWGKVFKNGPSKICGRQALQTFNYGLLRQTISLQIFKKLSYTNLTWSIFGCPRCFLGFWI